MWTFLFAGGEGPPGGGLGLAAGLAPSCPGGVGTVVVVVLSPTAGASVPAMTCSAMQCLEFVLPFAGTMGGKRRRGWGGGLGGGCIGG